MHQSDSLSLAPDVLYWCQSTDSESSPCGRTAGGLRLPVSVSLMISLVSTDTVSASSRRNRTAMCTAAWHPLPPLPCSNTPSRSGRNLQGRAEDSDGYLLTLYFIWQQDISKNPWTDFNAIWTDKLLGQGTTDSIPDESECLSVRRAPQCLLYIYTDLFTKNCW